MDSIGRRAFGNSLAQNSAPALAIDGATTLGKGTQSRGIKQGRHTHDLLQIPHQADGVPKVGIEPTSPCEQQILSATGRSSCTNTCGNIAESEGRDTQNNTDWPRAWPGVGQDSSIETSHVPPSDPVELALADALQRASVAWAWTTVERLAGEMEARRKERLNAAGVAPVVTLNSARKGKRKTEPPAIDPRQTDLFKK